MLAVRRIDSAMIVTWDEWTISGGPQRQLSSAVVMISITSEEVPCSKTLSWPPLVRTPMPSGGPYRPRRSRRGAYLLTRWIATSRGPGFFISI